MVNAIILAAGKSTRFAPFTYEKPKGLFRVKGEILIERQIEQLIEAGIVDIYVVVGYMKEKFFYLESKYPGVHLVVNNTFAEKGNLYSLFVAGDYLADTYICCADHYFTTNPFMEKNPLNQSYRACAYHEGKFREFAVSSTDADVLTGFAVGGMDQMAMVGHAYFNSSFSARFRSFMEQEIDDFGVGSMFWEEFYARHQNELTLYKREFAPGDILEFDDIEELREFDSEFFLNVDSEIISNICSVLHCAPNDITNIAVINAGLTNVSFGFDVRDVRYVYRHPGGTAGNLIDRQAEYFAQTKAVELGIDKSVIHIDLAGWKLSYYVKDARNCDFEKYPEQLKTGMDFLHRLHGLQSDGTVKVFDDVEEGKKLMRIASSTKGNLCREFKTELEKVEKLYEFVRADAERLSYDLVPCHNDTYEPNYLYDDRGEMYLIDWEYAGMNYAANDICCITCRYDWTEEQIERYFEAFVGRKLTEDEHRFYWAMHCICAFYWFNWGLYKGSVGDDDGFFFLPAYRNFCKYIDRVIVSYEQIESVSHISDEQERANGVGSVTAIILAGGVGSRVGADRPKQFVEVLGKPVLAYTIEIFQEHPEVDNIEVVCHKQWKDYLENMVKRYNLAKVKWIADGGETFQDSVMSGVNNLKGKISDDDYVLIQYGAAPFTSQKIVDDVIRIMREHNSAVTTTPCYQLMGSMDGVVSQNWVDRDKYIQIACPYGFQYGYLLDIYKRAEERNLLNTIEPHTTSLMYALGDELNLAYGDQTNIKITTAEDFDMFEGYVLMKQRRQSKKVDIAGGTTMKIQNRGGILEN